MQTDVDSTRRRNPRGQGDRLREEILDAAVAMVAQTGNLADLSLRSVAKAAGISAPSIYRHFPDLDHLAAEVIERCFAELAAARVEPDPLLDPVTALHRRLHGYVRFALENPGKYQVMFGPARLAAVETTYDRSPRRGTFESLVEAVARCAPGEGGDPVRTATLLWATVHGLASLHINRPNFPWPDLERLLDDVITRILAGDGASDPVHRVAQPAQHQREQ